MDEDSLRLLLARGVSVEEIGRRFHRHPSTVSYWLSKYGLEAPNRDKHAAKGGIPRERLEEMVADGLTIAAIAEAVGLSKGTVRHWLRRYGLTTGNARRRRGHGAEAADDGSLVGTCVRHGQTRFWRSGDGRLRCAACLQGYVTNRRRTVKQILIDEAGGCCAICGYDRYPGALQFHHRRREEKRFGLSDAGLARSLEKARAEARKCVLLCSNCHAEVEGGVAEPPA